MLVTASLLWMGLLLVQIAVLAQLILIGICALVFATVFGWRCALLQVPILALPIYATSVWGDLTNILVTLSGLAVGAMVKLVNIPAFIDGTSIFLPYGHIVIADGCSGGRYLVIGLAIGHLQACFNHYRPRAFALTLLVALMLGLIANWLRIFIIVMAGYFTEMQTSLVQDHETFGWILFAVLMAVPMYFAPLGRIVSPAINAPQPPLTRVLAGLVCLAAGPLILAMVDLTPHPKPAQNFLDSRLQTQSITQIPMPLVLETLGKSEAGLDSLNQVYWQANQYVRQSATDKLVPFIGRGYNPEQWAASNQHTAVGLGHAATYSHLRDKLSQREVVQLQWYQVGDQILASFWQAKLWQVPATLHGETRMVLVTLQAKCDADCTSAEEHLLASARQFTIP